MKIATAIIISLLAIVALVAEVLLYFFLGMGAALAGGANAVAGIAFFFVGLMVVTAAAAVLAPAGAVIELVAKKANLGTWILLGGLAATTVGYAGLAAVGRFAFGGLPSTAEGPRAPSIVANSAATPAAAPLLEVRLLTKRISTQDYQEFVFFDVEWRATGLKKAARAIKGVLYFQDLFGETKMKMGWTVDQPLAPGGTFVEKGAGLRYNQFMSDHQWIKSTDLTNMKASFVASQIIYQDGTREGALH